MENQQRHFPVQLRFFFESTRAISDERYRDALEIMRNGLEETIGNGQSVDSAVLISLLLMTVEELESTLRKAFGSAWEERLGIPEIPEDVNRIRCSFCGKAQEEVAKIIAGATVYICNECVGICNEIVSEGEQPKDETDRA